MRTLIIGGSSLLGRYLVKTKLSTDLALTWFRNSEAIRKWVTDTPLDITDHWYHLDIRHEADVFQLFDLVKPDNVILCAAIGGVDYAETNYQETADINCNGVKYVSLACNEYNSHLVYISTNAVFSGNNPPYNEKSPLNPVNAYGVIKRQAENIVRDIAKSWLILRPFLLYGWPYLGGRANWATTIIDRLGNKQRCLLVDDTIWMPTFAGDLANTVWLLLETKYQVYNVAAPERVTLYQFGQKVCEVFGLDKKLLEPVNSDYFPKIAKRPNDTSYDLVKLTEAGIMLSDIKTGLEKMRDEKRDNEL